MHATLELFDSNKRKREEKKRKRRKRKLWSDNEKKNKNEYFQAIILFEYFNIDTYLIFDSLDWRGGSFG